MVPKFAIQLPTPDNIAMDLPQVSPIDAEETCTIGYRLQVEVEGTDTKLSIDGTKRMDLEDLTQPSKRELSFKTHLSQSTKGSFDKVMD